MSPSRRRDSLGDLVELLAFRDVLDQLIKRDLRVRYKRSVLGHAWTLLNPLMMLSVTTIVFSHFFRFAIENYPVYMLSAYILWGFFAQGTVGGGNSVIVNAGLARKIYLPPALLPLAAVSSAAVNFLFSLVPLFLIMALTGSHFSWALLSLPLVLGLALLFTFGVALTLATASVFFHDTLHMYQVVLTAWMYLTPIFYPVEIMPPEWSFIFELNPMHHLLQIFRAPVYAGTWPDPVNLGAAAISAFVAAAFGWWYFERSRDAFASYL